MRVAERDRRNPLAQVFTNAASRSPQCRAAASAAFAEVERRLRASRGARAALSVELGACGSLERAEDQAELLGALQALVGGAVQYDGQAGAPLSVRQLCRFLLGDRGNCRGNGSGPAPYRGLRRAVQLPALPSELELCEQVFGLSTSSVAQAVAQTNSYYGGQDPGATQVLFVNGDTDPWHVLSVTQPLGPSEPALLIPSASHCLDMAPERPSDSPGLRLARQRVSSLSLPSIPSQKNETLSRRRKPKEKKAQLGFGRIPRRERGNRSFSEEAAAYGPGNPWKNLLFV
ncbi:hypothetical protein MG293_018586 [Ovis ammon polii]|uniref:Thymus-specific serine protease n=1 Tax=Ovis ammon polii TaxID=230172 RepID=A0AAD4Y143_OVIAM|nr:hypothetical protein MG293_018586 [Ovis ammon polii]